MNPVMNPAFAKSSFRHDTLPNWTCPTCERGLLALREKDTLAVQPNAETKANCREDWWDAEYGEYVFNGNLVCMNCGESVAVSGKGRVDQEYTDDGQGWEYVTMLTATYFIPPLKVISPKVNDQVPDQVRQLLAKAHEVCWTDPDSALNRLRTIVEEVLDFKGVPRTKGKTRHSLHARIKLFTETGAEQIQSALLALKYVGNDGSHGFSGISRRELLEVFSIVNYCLEKLFPIPIDDSDVLAVVERINSNEGLKKRKAASKQVRA